MEASWRRPNPSLMNGIYSLAIAAGVVGLLAACGGGGGGGGSHSDPYLQPWYDVYGYRCGSGTPRPGCNFYWDGTKIKDVNDPYFYSSYNLDYGTWSFTDSYGYARNFTGWAWWSPDNILYDDLGHALNEEGQNEASGADAIAAAAKQEEEVVSAVGRDFAAKYALSDEAGLNIARTLKDWAVLAKRRARTQADIAEFSKRLYGVSMESALAAFETAKAGDLSGVERVNGEIATYWGTGPETSREILKSWYKSELLKAGYSE